MAIHPIKRFLEKKAEKKSETAVNAVLPECVTPDPEMGLGTVQVEERMAAGLNNIPVSAPSKTVRQIILSNVLTYFNLIFFILAILLVFAGAFRDLMFLPVILCNIVIGTVQEINSKRTLDRLNFLAAPKATVIRNATQSEVMLDALVRDDIVIFSSGNQIPADAIVVDGSVSVNESLITGEADEVVKTSGAELLSGSFVVSGKCRARLTRVGADSYVSRLTLEAKKMHKKQEIGMMRSLNRLIQVIGVAIIPIGILLYLRQTLQLGLTYSKAITGTTAALIGMIPEGLYLLVSVALAVSVMRLARQKTLVHEMRCIEMLARVDVLCVDKTGTITSGDMEMTEIIPVRSSGLEKEAIAEILRDYAANMEADNATMRALKTALPKDGDIRRAVSVVGFSSERKFSGVSFGEGENFLLGAPEFLLRDAYSDYQPLIEPYTRDGSRVLMLVSTDTLCTTRAALGAVRPIAIVLFVNPIRPQAKETFTYFAKQGVSIKVISGDNPLTVSAAALKAGIPGAENSVDASTLHSPEDMKQALLNNTVFGRVSPEQKREFVRILKAEGHTVAMTGDGVNDVPSLKEANCSIAMASGSEVASQVAQLVLLDSNFACMPAVVAEGRRVINNIERSASLFLVKNIFSFFLAIISIIAVFSYPVTPSQLSLINVFTIGIPSFLLALEPNTNLVSGKFLRNVMTRAFPAAMTNLVLVIGVVLFSMAFPEIEPEVSTIAALIMGIDGILMLATVCRPFDVKRIIMFIAMILGLLLGLIFFSSMFSMVALSFGGAMIFAVFALLAYPTMWSFHFVIEKVMSSFKRMVMWLKNKVSKMEI